MIYSFSSDIIVTDSTQEQSSNILLLKTGLNTRYINKEQSFITPLELWEKISLGNGIKIIGITGTNGKTTTSALIYSMLLDLGFRVALQGTRGFFVNGNKIESKSLTTPDVLLTFKHIDIAKKEECQFFIMEVSSHAIAQGRIEGIHFFLKMITNITQDHLDFHETFANYCAVKNSFLQDEVHKLINKDDDKIKASSLNLLTYGIENDATFKVESYSLRNGVSGVIRMGTSLGMFYSSLDGYFNLQNIVASIGAVISITGKNLQEVCESVEGFGGVEGRMQRVSTEPLVIVDFAHTPDGILRVLESLKDHSLVVVFGAGGDRDKEKRPLMGEVVSRFAKKIYITSDNPRNEEPQAIIDAIYKGIHTDSLNKVYTFVSRYDAIYDAIMTLEENDVLLILGKGDETEQIFYDYSEPFDDREVARIILEKKRS